MALLLLLLPCLALALDTGKYCAVSSRHTLCGYSGRPGSQCSGLGIRGLTTAQQQGIADYHNRWPGALGGTLTGPTL